MNTANLQLEGMLLALYALCDAMKAKGLLQEHELEEAFASAEANALSDPIRITGLSESNVAGLLFPIRFLKQANAASHVPETFSTITQLVAEAKDRQKKLSDAT